jgi:hypothetical protein
VRVVFPGERAFGARLLSDTALLRRQSDLNRMAIGNHALHPVFSFRAKARPHHDLSTGEMLLDLIPELAPKAVNVRKLYEGLERERRRRWRAGAQLRGRARGALGRVDARPAFGWASVHAGGSALAYAKPLCPRHTD